MSALGLPTETVRPRSVGAVVRAAQLGLYAARTLECALLFAAGALLALGAARLSGAETGARDVALLCGALAAASWWLEHASPRVATARALDVALRHDGALALAFELEESHDPGELSGMEQLVRARVLARLTVREALRAVFPPLSVPLAAPAVAALFLLFALDQRGARDLPARDLGSMGAELERLLAAGLEPEGASLAADGADELRREVQELRPLLEDLAEQAPASGQAARAAEEARVRLERLDERMVRELRSEIRASELARLDEARAWIDALRTALPGPATSTDSGTASGAGGTDPGSLTGTSLDGTISPPMSGPDTLPPDAPGTTPSLTLGLQAGSFWPGEYDAVVERWVELSRAARADQGR